jgi:hypothetical protein
LSKFPEAVLTGLDTRGDPFSVRVSTRNYDAATGELPMALPDALEADESRANILCHYHDDKMWHLDTAQVKGELRRQGDGWVFISEKFTPQSRWQAVSFLSFLKGARTAAQKYLDKRGLTRPAVNWAAVEELRRRAVQQRTTSST